MNQILQVSASKFMINVKFETRFSKCVFVCGFNQSHIYHRLFMEVHHWRKDICDGAFHFPEVTFTVHHTAWNRELESESQGGQLQVSYHCG